MEDFIINLDTDINQVKSHHFLEIPVHGPGLVNYLVIITGIAISRLDMYDFKEGTAFGSIYIKTDYRIKDQDTYKEIVNGNKNLIAATYVSLSSIAADDDTEVIFAVNSVITEVIRDGTIQLHIQAAVLGDVTLNSISYQANILIHKAT